ncbi:MAG: LysE family transporter [Patescibacteria group bacterium]
MIEYVAGLSWGTLVGFAIAVPVGPVGLICIQRTLSRNRKSGLVSGLGAAVADVLLASIGAFSITIVFSFISGHKSFLGIIGGFLLLFLGIMSLISKPKERAVEPDTALDYVDEFLSAFVLTITNPFSAFSFFVAFGAVSSKIGDGLSFAITFVVGVFIGSCLWWILLTYVTDRIAHRITPEHIKTTNKVFACIIAILGATILLGVLFK